MKDAVTVRAERDAFFFGLFDRLFVGSVCRELVNLLGACSQDVMKVDDRWVRRPAMHTRLFGFVVDPHFPVAELILCGRLHMFFSVPLIPRVCVLALILWVFVRQSEFLWVESHHRTDLIAQLPEMSVVRGPFGIFVDESLHMHHFVRHGLDQRVEVTDFER